MLPEFRNEPLTDFSVEAHRNAFRAALAKVEERLPLRGWNRIGGKRASAAKHFESVNPCDFRQVVGRFPGTPWRTPAAPSTPPRKLSRRGAHARRRALGARPPLAAILRRRKHEFSAMMVFEVGKTWAEADGDTAEAIDFLRVLRARDAALRRPAAGDAVSRARRTSSIYIPLGVGAVIPPWNFPLAILAGMTTAALVAGNTVVLKPSTRLAGDRGDVLRAAWRRSGCRRAS